MELHKVANNTHIKVLDDIKVPVGAPSIKKGEILKFYHIDGMYSKCMNKKGDIVHLVAWAQVEPTQEKVI